MFAEDLLIIDRLRTEAINVQEPHVTGISRLVTYAAQLKWLSGKFPIDVSALYKDGSYGFLMKRGMFICDIGWGGISVVSCIWVEHI